VKQSAITEGADIAILGAGPIGLSVLLAASAKATRSAYVTDKLDYRADIAKQAGATWSGNPDKLDPVEAILDQQPGGMDVVYECAGQPETLDTAVSLLKPGGKLMLIGIPREPRVSFIIDQLRRKEITVINVRRQNGCVQEAIDLIASGKVDVDFMTTHRYTLGESQEAFDLVAGYEDGVIKAMIEFEG
ncbi:MAG: zinc-binding dehydrogenase, partial [Phycisphaerae bacterium]|nr:zinc-binding dehydrogenase [Phycisphaerae bacterium]